MPVILNHDKIDNWIDSNTSAEKAMNYLNPFYDELIFHPVSNFVNSPRNNSGICIKPIIEEIS